MKAMEWVETTATSLALVLAMPLEEATVPATDCLTTLRQQQK